MLMTVRSPSRTITTLEASLKRSASALPSGQCGRVPRFHSHLPWLLRFPLNAARREKGQPGSAAGRAVRQAAKKVRGIAGGDEPEMAVGRKRGDAAARGALQVALLDEEGLEDVLEPF